jgi:hypothetical protein
LSKPLLTRLCYLETECLLSVTLTKLSSTTIPVRQKLTSAIPSHSRQAKTSFLHSNQVYIVNKFSLLSLPCRSWSPNYSALFSSQIYYILYIIKNKIHVRINWQHLYSLVFIKLDFRGMAEPRVQRLESVVTTNGSFVMCSWALLP